MSFPYSSSLLNVWDNLPTYKLLGLVGGTIVLVKLFHAILRPITSRHPLPPGPPPLPILGNLLDLPKEKEWLTFGAWSEKWGDVMHLAVPGQPGLVILSSVKAATDLLEKQSSIYSDRPVVPMGGELVGWDRILGLTRYTPVSNESNRRFKTFRKLIHQVIGSPSNLRRFDTVVENGTRRLLERILKDPEETRWETIQDHIRTMTGGIALRIIYGYDAKDHQDPFVTLIGDAMSQFSLSIAPGLFLVNNVPVLKYIPSWFPGAGFKKTAEAWRHVTNRTADEPFEWTQAQMRNGNTNLSFVSDLIAAPGFSPEDEELMKWAATSLYAGAADTTVSSLYGFVLAMVLYPEAMKRAQQELDSVVGTERLPTLADRPDLPYLDALTSEVLRWNPIGPLGLPHRAVEDNVYEGKFIPKDTLIFANIWQMSHDPNVYDDPGAFKPERFMGLSPELDPRGYVWGFGRRICPGRLLADSSVFIACAMVLAVFDITKYKENGVTVDPVVDQTTGIVTHPKVFKCSIRPRSTKAESLVTSGAHNAL